MSECTRCGDGRLDSRVRSTLEESPLRRRCVAAVPFGFALLTFAAIPSAVGYQDLASLIAARAGMGDRAGEQGKSPFGTFHAATFRFPRPVGTAVPDPVGYRVASLDMVVDRAALTGAIGDRALFDLSARPPALDRDPINRTRKGDRLVPRAVAEWIAREQAVRAAAAPLAAPEPPAVVAALPAADTARTAPAPTPAESPAAAAATPPAPTAKPRTGWPVVLPQTEAHVAAETAEALAGSDQPSTPAAAPRPAARAVAEAPIISAEAFSGHSLAWLGSEPEPAPRPAARRSRSQAVATQTASVPTAPVPTAPVQAVAAETAPVESAAAEPAAAEPQQSFVLASASTDIVIPRAVTPRAELPGPPAPAAAPAPEHAAVDPAHGSEPFQPDTAMPTLGETSPTLVAAHVYFGAEPLAGTGGALQPWSPGSVSIAPDSDTELTALDEITPSEATLRAAIDPDGGETIVRKGEVVPGDGHALRSPAERLGLYGGERAKAEKCLADAVYFESRGEPLRGQIAVAQVVMNRVFSGYYPTDVCGVVYQNAHRHLSCQFTFACDGIKDKITEPDAWERAQRVATETLDGKHWLSDVGKATHYHAYWVRPWWVRTMHKLDKIGVHTFYRPRKWGDGADRPAWGDASLPPPAEKITDRL